MDAIELLTYSKEQCEARKAANKDKGDSYNLFEVLNLSTNEVACHSRFMYDLLNPRGSHGMGDVFLRSFLSSVSNVNDYDLSNVRVDREYAFNDGRIDLLIEMPGKWCIVVEVKIYAGDQWQQLIRYRDYAEDWKARNGSDADYKIFYITLDGHEASEQSVGNEPLEYTAISFKEHITSWISQCIEFATNKERLVTALNEYLELIKYLSGWFEMDEYAKKVYSEITTTADAYLAAKQIYNCVDQAQTDLLHKIFMDIEDHLNEKCQRRNVTTQMERDDLASYYSRNIGRNPWPRLRYELLSVDNKRLALAVELWRGLLCIGIVLYEAADKKSGIKRNDNDREWLSNFGTEEWKLALNANKNDWWIDWDWLDCERSNEDGQISFLNCDSSEYADLFTEAGYNTYIQKVKTNIDKYLTRVNNFELAHEC